MPRRRNPFRSNAGPFGGAPGGRFSFGPPPRRVRGRWLGRFLVLLIVLVCVGVGVAVVLNQSSPRDTGAPPSALPTLEPRPSAPAEIPGWVAVTDSGRTIAYDVPADWTVSYVGDGQTVDLPNWSLALTMTATYLSGYCESAPSSFRAQSGAATVEDPNATTAATDTARNLATALYGPADSGAGAPPTVTLSTPRQLTAHGRTGTLVTAQITVHRPDRCEPPTAIADVYAIPNPGKHESLVVVAYADQRFTGAVGQHDLDTIVTSIRQLSAH